MANICSFCAFIMGGVPQGAGGEIKIDQCVRCGEKTLCNDTSDYGIPDSKLPKQEHP